MRIMKAKPERGCLVVLAALLLASCGGGGGGSAAVVAPTTLVSIALSPRTLSLVPGGTQQLAVVGTYSNGTMQALAAAGETFTSSNTNVATVSATGLTTVAANAALASTATISATDTATGLATSSANSTVLTVIASGGPPTPTSVTAAEATAAINALCTAITPFYWEIGDQGGPLASGSLGTLSNGKPVTATTNFSIASASKWIYGAYVVQIRGSAAALTAQDIPFMNFTSGYTNMTTSLTSSDCPVNTVNLCLALINPSNGLPFTYNDPTTVGKFDYNSGHLQNHASQLGGLGDVPVSTLGTTVAAQLDPNVTFLYTEPLMAGGIVTSSNDYTQVLRDILSGALFMHDALGTNAVCTLPTAVNCNAVFTPIPEAWHYSIAHWVEDDPATHGDGAFSSAGAFGFYPWIDQSKTYYGVISRMGSSAVEQNGYASAQCGRLIRHAWDTGVEQTGTIPM